MQASTDTIATFLAVLQICYSLVLLVVYLSAFTVRSIATARPDNDNVKQPLLGPGGEFASLTMKQDRPPVN